MALILFTLALAAVVPSQQSPPPLPRQHVVIGMDNVDLAGAGELWFDPDADQVLAALGITAFAPTERNLGTARITFNRQGRAVACVPGESGSQGPGLAALCEQISAKARFQRNFGFDLPYDTGQLAVAFWGSSALTIVEPVVIQPAGAGYDLTMVMVGERCQIEANPFTAWEKEAICTAWIKAGRPGLMPSGAAASAAPAQAGARTSPRSPATRKRASRPVRPATPPRHVPPAADSVRIARIAVKLGPNRNEITVGERMIWRDADLIYPEVPFSERPPIGTGNGELESRVATRDYPSLALREGIGGIVRILVGFRRDGEPMSCRPIASSGTAYLDNVTCRVAMRRLNFRFSDRISEFSGLRYETKDFRWVIPKD